MAEPGRKRGLTTTCSVGTVFETRTVCSQFTMMVGFGASVPKARVCNAVAVLNTTLRTIELRWTMFPLAERSALPNLVCELKGAAQLSFVRGPSDENTEIPRFGC